MSDSNRPSLELILIICVWLQEAALSQSNDYNSQSYGSSSSLQFECQFINEEEQQKLIIIMRQQANPKQLSYFPQNTNTISTHIHLDLLHNNKYIFCKPYLIFCLILVLTNQYNPIIAYISKQNQIKYSIQYISEKKSMNNSGALLSTKGFINSRCKKDHIASPLKNPKMKSLYTKEFSKSKMKTEAHDHKANDIGRYKNQVVKGFSENNSGLIPNGSIYQMQFQETMTGKPEMHHERESFFLKQQHYENLTSQYKRKMSPENLNKEMIKLLNEKGKEKMGNLIVPKTNRMSEITSYRQTYARNRGMLPSIHKQNDHKTANYVPKASLHRKSTSNLWTQDQQPAVLQKYNRYR